MKAAKRISQRLAHSSTRRNAGELIFRVRDGYGRNLAAVAAVMPTGGIEPPSDHCRSIPIWVSRDMNGGGETDFPEARALQYSPERRRAYLPCSGWVREEPRRCGRCNVDRRNRTAVRPLSMLDDVSNMSEGGESHFPEARALQYSAIRR